jgi:thioredoxin-related protein
MKCKIIMMCALFWIFPLSSGCSGDIFSQSIAEAKKANKKLFIIYGKNTCTRCQNLQQSIRNNSIQISNKDFIILKVDANDQKQRAEFNRRYSVSGSSLPLVVITRPDGTMISSRSGYYDDSEYNLWIQEVM